MNKAIELSLFLYFSCLTSIHCQNCSTYNPCGTYGYCVDNTDDHWQCQCKFWWNGTRCDQQSSSGIQVITLGILTGISIVLFYALSIFYTIKRKKHQPKQEEAKQSTSKQVTDPKLTSVAVTNVKRSARLSSCLILIVTLIVTVLALITKWLLLRPIHNELVEKYQQEEPVFYNRSSFCSVTDIEGINMLTFPIACFLLLIFILSSKRTSCLKNKLRAYIGPIIPIDFYVHIKRKFAAVIFAIVADELLDIVNQVLNGDKQEGEGVIVVYLFRIARVLIIGIHYYPILSAVYLDTILALFCATVYAWLVFIISIVSSSICTSNFYPSEATYDATNGSDIIEYFEFYGTGSNLFLIQLFTDLPRYICWSYIVIKLPAELIKKIYKKYTNQLANPRLTREEKILLHSSLPYSVEMRYVRNRFRSTEQQQQSKSRLFIGRLIPKKIYQWRDDFRFSSRILCIYAAVFLLLFFMTVESCVQIVPNLSEFHKNLQIIIDALTKSVDSTETQTIFPLPDFVRPFVIAILTAFVITILQLLVLLANIRRNLLQIYRGDDCEIPKRSKSNFLSYSTGNFHFAGYFIGYLIWGYVLIVIFALIIYICIDAFITYGSVEFLEKILKSIIPVLLLIIFKLYINKFLARYVFLQYYGEILAINNRRALMIFLYFNFFLDAFLGLISSVIRIIKSVIGGFLYMSRLDYSPLGRKLEHLDAGFSAYCGFIHLEAVHRNPIMLAVASYLYSQMKAKQYINQKRKQSSLQAIRKWHLAIVLIQNPSLVPLRKHRLLQNQNKISDSIDENKRKYSYLEDNHHRPSLVSEVDLRNIWQKN